MPACRRREAAVSLLRRRRDELRVTARGRPPKPRSSTESELTRIDVMAQRVEALEARLGHDSLDARETVAKRLLARLARARSADPETGESLPVIVDDPLLRVPVDRRHDLLDMLMRVSERMQVIYVTDDPVVMRWARHTQGGRLASSSSSRSPRNA